jgi:hypothetical protein
MGNNIALADSESNMPSWMLNPNMVGPGGGGGGRTNRENPSRNVPGSSAANDPQVLAVGDMAFLLKGDLRGTVCVYVHVYVIMYI